jgi:hypothetical protein
MCIEIHTEREREREVLQGGVDKSDNGVPRTDPVPATEREREREMARTKQTAEFS